MEDRLRNYIKSLSPGNMLKIARHYGYQGHFSILGDSIDEFAGRLTTYLYDQLILGKGINPDKIISQCRKVVSSGSTNR